METESTMLGARRWGGGGELVFNGSELPSGKMQRSGEGRWWWLPNSVNVLNATGQCAYKGQILCYVFSSVQSLNRVRLFATPWTAAHQASLSITNSWSLLKLMSTESVMPSNHLILCHPLLLPPLIFPSIGVFSNESTLCIRWPKYWSFSFNISLSNEYSGLISFRMDWLDLLAV